MTLQPRSLLDSATTLAVQSFSSLKEAIDATLEMVVRTLNMRSAFLTRTDVERQLLRVEAVRNESPAFQVPLGLELPLSQTP
jgi:hypothetical protein